VPVRNDAARLARCLAAISRTAGVGTDVVVVDNGSTDESASVARAAGAQVLVVPAGSVAALRNRGAASATGEAFAFVDADHEIQAGWVAAARDVLGESTVGAVGAKYLAPAHGTWVQRLFGALRGTTDTQADVAWLGSGNLVVRRAAFQQIGGFDEALVACEDVDLCQRLRAGGWRLVADPRLESVHYGDPPTLGALFRAERWRGRDNMRVTLRGPLAARDLPGLLIPVVELLCVMALVSGALTLPWEGLRGWLVTGAALAIVLALWGARTVAIAVRAHPQGPRLWLQAAAVAFTYDVARAAALVTSAPHHRRATRA
jgi:hypothetical protein